MDKRIKVHVDIPLSILGREYALTVSFDENELKKAAAILDVVDERYCIAGWAEKVVEKKEEA